MQQRIADAVGFDLDNTLYRETLEMKIFLKNVILRKAGKTLGESVESIELRYQELFLATQSARRSLEMLGVTAAAAIVQEALEEADIASILTRDDRLVSLFEKIQPNYPLFLITGSSDIQSNRKLEALGLHSRRFRVLLYADSQHKRYDGSAFAHVSKILEVPLRRLFFVGDREQADIIPAKKLGIKTAIVHAKSGIADYQLDTIYDLENIL